MGDASYLQSSFLGGRWSPYYQGRFTDERYRTALAECLNVIPLEEGAATRRPGTRYIAATKGGTAAALRRFGFTASAPYVMEFTAGFLRLVYGAGLVLTPTTQDVVSISTDDPAVITIAAAPSPAWNTGDEVQFSEPAGVITEFGTASLLNRQFLITVLSGTTFSISDSVTGAPIDGSTLSLGASGMQVSQVLRFTTPYLASELNDIRTVQAINNENNQVFIFHPKHPPMVLTAVSNPDAAFDVYATFALTPAIFLDGPYLDPPTDGATLTPSAKTGVINLTAGFANWSSSTTYGIGDVVAYSGVGYISLVDSNLNNQPDTSTTEWQPENEGVDASTIGFQSTDIGRSIRLFSEPANWSSAAGYITGNTVKFDGSYWQALQANTGKQPGLDVVNWAVDPTAAVWTWGRIQSVVSATEVTLQLLGGALLYTNAIVSWQLGRYSNTTGWPTTGCYHEGRLWLVGLQGNHFDGSMTNQTLTWSPTGADGTVADNNSIAETLNDQEVDPIFWMLTDHNGIVCGTQGGEWVIQASALNDPLTPTSIQAKKVTKYGQENIDPVHAPLAFLTVQRYARKTLEYISDVYSGKYSATNIGITASDLIQSGGGVAQITYQQERTPIAWARLNDGSLIGMTYRRDSPFGTQPAQFSAWHRHELGSGNIVTSISGGAAAGGETDTLVMVTQNPISGVYWLELLTDIFDETADITDAWFLDGADLPFLVQLNPSGLNGLRLYGYYYLAGQTVQVFVAGVDYGSVLVNSDGHIDLTFGGDPNGLFTLARVEEITADYQSLFPDKASFVSNGSTPAPFVPTISGIRGFVINEFGQNLAFLDWKNNYLTLAGSGGSSDQGWSVCSLLSGENVSAFDVGSLNLPGVDPDFTGAVGADGFYYQMIDYGANSGRVAKLTPGGQAAGLYGALNVNLYSGAGHTAQPHACCAVSAYHQFYVQTSATSDSGLGQEIVILDGTVMQPNNNNPGGPFVTRTTIPNVAGVRLFGGSICTGKQTNDGLGHYYGEAYSIQNVDGSAGANLLTQPAYTNDLQFWKTSIQYNPPTAPAVTFTNVWTLASTAIDPNWKWWANDQFIAYDTTDGNLLMICHIATPQTFVSGAITNFFVGEVILGSNGHAYKCTTAAGAGTADPTTDAGAHWTDLGAPAYTNTSYIVKLNAVTGAVLWTIPINDGAYGWMTPLWGQSLIENGRLGFLDYAGLTYSTLLWIDTIAGTVLDSLPIQLVALGGGQVWGPSGIVFKGGYTDSPGAPVPVYPATGGFSGRWAQFQAIPSVATQLVLPIIVGYTYTSRGQLLRPIAPQEAGAQNGPALGKTRRSHMVSYLFHGAQGVSLGTDFVDMHACNFMLNGSSTVPLPLTSLYNDVYWDHVEDDYSFNSQPTWQVTRPYPCTVLAVEAFLHTQDR